MKYFCLMIFFLGTLSQASANSIWQEGQEPEQKGEPKIQLQLVDTDIHDALRMVGQQGGMNMVVSNEVKGNVTLNLQDATMMEAQQAIVEMGGYEYSIDGNIITVKTLQEILDGDKLRQEMKPKPEAKQEVLVLELRYVDAERMMSVIG